ncbi:MAG: gamma-glutamyltransferase [Actinomycetota bacterium]|nr:gamma-glutamyltransferase [Actinomycetota bacterium]
MVTGQPASARSTTVSVAAGGAILAAVLVVPVAPATAAVATSSVATGVATAGVATRHGAPLAPSRAALRRTEKVAVAEGFGGAVSTVDPEASAAGVRILRKGGNAVDAAVAAAATLGVTEPFSAGIGGGGFFVYYNAKSGKVRTIDGRETAPRRADEDLFIDPATGEPYPFFPERVTSGISVGVPGTLLTWQKALDKWGTKGLGRLLRPGKRVARHGFVVDQTFRDQTAANAERFAQIVPTRHLFLPGGQLPRVGSVFRNRSLARTYRVISRNGINVFYAGRIARDIVRAVQQPPVTPDATLPVPPGDMRIGDLERYVAPMRKPTHVRYRGVDVYGMGPPSSGGSTVGEALNILQGSRLGRLGATQRLHRYFESSALAFADRNRFVGDPDYVDVPLEELLSDDFAGERSCQIDRREALVKPVDPGSPDGDYAPCDGTGSAPAGPDTDTEGRSTTHLTVADRRGNVVSYTLTIEQTGGSGIAVPGRGFLLNNELTDFNAEPTEGDAPDPNLVEPDKRPRSSMAPTIVLRDGEPWLAVGSPGGSTIITTVLQILLNRIDRNNGLPKSIRKPRATQRNTPTVIAEPRFLDKPVRDRLESLGHEFTSIEEIGAATGVQFLRDGRLQAVAEPTRRGGGSARVVSPAK